MANPLQEFLRAATEAASEVSQGALEDVRTTWEALWFGKELTPEQPAATDPLGRYIEAEKEFERAMDGLWDSVHRMDSCCQKVDESFGELLDELAKERAGRKEPEHEVDVER